MHFWFTGKCAQCPVNPFSVKLGATSMIYNDRILAGSLAVFWVGGGGGMYLQVLVILRQIEASCKFNQDNSVKMK